MMCLIAKGVPYSAVYELELPPTSKVVICYQKILTYGPEKPVWQYIAPDTLSFFSSFISGAHRMPNGNTFINEGAKGRFFEVTPDGKKVWEYINPYRGDVRMPNGDPIPPVPLTYITFRSNFIPAGHPGTCRKKLDPMSPQPAVYTLPSSPSARQ